MTTSLSAMGGIVRRKEDPALITGQGKYVDDIRLNGEAVAAFVRSPFAHARVNGIDTAAAEAMPGVLAVYTIDDVRDLGPLLAQVPVGALRPLLADGAVHHVGEAVAMVVAENSYVARDAADTVMVDYDPLPAVVDMKEAVAGEARAHEGAESNVLVTWYSHDWWPGVFELTDHRPAIEEAKQRDDVVIVSQEMINQRLIPTAIEPRAVLADWSHGYGRVELWSSTQMPHALAGAVAKTFGLPSNDVHVVAPEVGGGFGAKLNIYPDEMLTVFASKQLGRPVRWTETRREATFSTIQGRGWIATATITGTKDGEILGYELDAIADMGAYSQNFTVAIPVLGLFVAQGQYDIPLAWQVSCVQTNTQTTDAYRGAGRPEAAYYVERIIDMYAAAIGMDPADVRRKNFFKKEQFPATTAIGLTMDSGDYERNLDTLIADVDYAGLREMQAAARAEGRYLGIGLSTYVEVCGFAPSVLAEFGFGWDAYGMPTSFSGSGLVRVNPDGSATVIIGTGPSGQGHQTTWAQVVSDRLGIDFDSIRVAHGNTAESPTGVGTFGSRSAAVDGAATYEAAEKVGKKAAEIVAHMLEASAEDIRFADGGAHVAGSPGHKVTWADIAEVAYKPHKGPEGIEAGLEAHVVFSPANATWPFGSHLAVVEVDPDTGNVEILRYIGVDDCGNRINPMIVDGQIHGGIAQGIGQAMFEEAIYDDDGNLLSGSMIDYPIPTAGDLPAFELGWTNTPTDVNPMGVKGIGEAGTIGSAQTIVNAVVDAVSPLGVKHIDMPLRPRKVWGRDSEGEGLVMYPRSFEYIAATSLDEALAALADNPGAKVMTGGMSLIPLMKLRLFSPSLVVDIGRVPGLDSIDDAGDHLAIGALVRHATTASSDAVKSGAAALAQAASLTGDVQVRNRGTTCGALAHADIAADQTAAALALGATMVAKSSSGERTIAASDFFVDTLTSALQADEILVEVRIPKAGAGTGSAYGKLGRRGGQSDYAVAGAAAVVTMDGGSVTAAQVALTGVGTKPALAAGVAEALVGTDGSSSAIAEASARAVEGVTVLEDLYGSEEYKAHLAQVYSARAITAAIAAAG